MRSPQVWPWWRVARIGSTWVENPRGQGPWPVPEVEEIARVAPVIRELSKRLPATVRVSVDTYKAATGACGPG